jgi:hypothetical protein
MRLVLKNQFVLGLLCLSIMAFSACSNTDNQTGSEENPINTPVAGNETTEQYAEKPGTVEEGKTDPYTKSQDKENVVDKHPIAKDQTAGEKIGDDAATNNQGSE